MGGILKRKFAEVDKNPCSSSTSPPTPSQRESDGEGSSPENMDFTPHSPAAMSSLPICSILKRPKRSAERSSVRFNQVTVFSFARCQGFTSVPSRGGATLGMMRRHSGLQRFTVEEHALEQQRRRQERRKEELRHAKFEALKHKLIMSGAVDQHAADDLSSFGELNDDADVCESTLEDADFLQPFPSKQRQAILLEAGVTEIDKEEKRQLHLLRLSREACGCDCQGFCEPETCACSQAGIQCQVDRFNFPCGCTKDNCENMHGRIEFDARRVQTHYIHTVMRLELERRLQGEKLSTEEQVGLPKELHENEEQGKVCLEQSSQEKRCPFESALEEEGLPLTMPAPPVFDCEENSCNTDMSDSSCSDSGYLSELQSPPEEGGGLNPAHTSLCDSKNNNCFACSHLRHVRGPLLQHTCSSSSLSTSPENMAPSRIYYNENANQTSDLFDDDSLDDIPNELSPTVDYSFSGYMDLSLSSDSDLEFFPRDYPSGPPHCSFKQRPQQDAFQHLQLFVSVQPTQSDSNSLLLESLIGLIEPSTEHICSDTQIL